MMKYRRGGKHIQRGEYGNFPTKKIPGNPFKNHVNSRWNKPVAKSIISNSLPANPDS
jgi:hypothetical protein